MSTVRLTYWQLTNLKNASESDSIARMPDSACLQAVQVAPEVTYQVGRYHMGLGERHPPIFATVFCSYSVGEFIRSPTCN